MSQYQYVEEAISKEKASVPVQALNDAKQTEKELLKQGKLFFIKRGKTIIQTTYPEKYDTRSEDSNWM